ncbi:MAG TPA: PfkB family carbohydrate kinase [Longimicrobiaceae bacterium]
MLCIGELLWDSLPAGLFPGGAPFNVAGHLHALGVPVAVISRVGRDRLGTEAIARLSHLGIDPNLVQVDDTLPTGFVSVVVAEGGIPSYEIEQPAAWDGIELAAGVRERAAEARAIVFGSLAQRSRGSRDTIRRLWQADALQVFDVNLRPPFEDREIVRESLTAADMVKLNEGELGRLAGWFGLPANPRRAAEALGERFGCATVCVTRGAEGATLLREGRWTEHAGFAVEVRDTVGAGDAFLAALLAGLLSGRDDEALLRAANLLGAYVASRDGAIPPHDRAAIAGIQASESTGRTH